MGVSQLFSEISMLTDPLYIFLGLRETCQDILQLLTHVSDFVLQGSVPPILAVVVSAAEQGSRDVCPPILEYPFA